jgi:hypothetical protein
MQARPAQASLTGLGFVLPEQFFMLSRNLIPQTEKNGLRQRTGQVGGRKNLIREMVLNVTFRGQRKSHPNPCQVKAM